MTTTSRSAESREHNPRTKPYGERSNLLTIPPGVERPGYKYKWACISIRGEETGDVTNAMSIGWEIVPKSRQTSNNYIEPTIKTRFSEEGIVRKDCLLMEMDEKRYEYYIGQYQDKNESEVRNLRGLSRDGRYKPEIVAYI